MWSVYLAVLAGTAAAVDIAAFGNTECRGRTTQVCRNIAPGACCVLPTTRITRSLYVGTFPLPGGIGNWHAEGTGTACGRTLDSDGDANSVCLSAYEFANIMGGRAGGGGSWYPVSVINPATSRSGSIIPNIAVPMGYKNIAPFRASGYKERKARSLEDREAERRDAEEAMSLDQWQHMLDTDPALKCNGTQRADVFGWEAGNKGVWVLEDPTEEQYEKLAAFPETTNQTLINTHLETVGAKHYDDYSDHDGALYLMNKFGDHEEVTKTIAGIGPSAIASSQASAKAH